MAVYPTMDRNSAWKFITEVKIDIFLIDTMERIISLNVHFLLPSKEYFLQKFI